MVRRKIKPEESENHERWLISYADFITLLFAFFVVMYSVSSVNEGKYRVLSKSLDDAFSSKKTVQQGNDPMAVSEGSSKINPIKLDHLMTLTPEVQKSREISATVMAERRRLKQISSQFKAVLEPYIKQNLVAVKENDFWLELELKSKILFASGEADLTPRALPIIKKIAEIIRRTRNMINVEGHTDNVPIDTVEFPSNWDLASARAASVVRQLVEDGINPARLAAVGYGEFHPIADNNSVDGRFKNRRVLLVLLSGSVARYGNEENGRENLHDSPSAVKPVADLNRS